MTSEALADQVDGFRQEACAGLLRERRALLGQFLTPPPVARLMASMIDTSIDAIGPALHVLDAGAGVGALLAALVIRACQPSLRPAEISVTAIEIEPAFLPYLQRTLAACERLCAGVGVRFRCVALQQDFIRAARDLPPVNCAILNPPYRKVRQDSDECRLLRQAGLRTSNLYTGFLWLATRLLGPGGQLCAITPRSFCNGPYFQPFRQAFLAEMALQRIHVFTARDRAFRQDAVLQENVIFCARKDPGARGKVLLSSSDGPEDGPGRCREVDPGQVVRPGDPQQFIHLHIDPAGAEAARRMERLPTSLAELGLGVSTGRVVDFRAREFLRRHPGPDTVPLIYPGHLASGGVRWPLQQTRKPNAIALAPLTEGLLLPAGTYVLVRRFSAKEERRRVVAALYEPESTGAERVGFENHLNVYHKDGAGLDRDLARGLLAFLNSALVDTCLRQFSGHTQVNATDLRSLRYPSREELCALGSATAPSRR